MENNATVKMLDERMKKTIASLKSELSKIRGNRANVAILDDLRIDCYGTLLPVNQVGTVSAPEPRLIVITPWDKNSITAIEKAVQASSIGLSTSNDGNLVRLSLPPLS